MAKQVKCSGCHYLILTNNSLSEESSNIMCKFCSNAKKPKCSSCHYPLQTDELNSLTDNIICFFCKKAKRKENDHKMGKQICTWCKKDKVIRKFDNSSAICNSCRRYRNNVHTNSFTFKPFQPEIRGCVIRVKYEVVNSAMCDTCKNQRHLKSKITLDYRLTTFFDFTDFDDNNNLKSDNFVYFQLPFEGKGPNLSYRNKCDCPNVYNIVSAKLVLLNKTPLRLFIFE